MLLYKYIDQNIVNILKDLTLKVNDPEEFNDPFDCKPGIIPFQTNGERKGFIKNKDILDYYYDKFRQKGMVSNKKEFKARWRERRLNILESLDDVGQAARQAWESVHTSDFFLILCLSDEIKNNYDEILMWSHYTDGHKGARVKIDTDHISTPCIEVKDIKYLEDRPSFHVSDIILDKPKVQDVTIRSLFVKSPSWAYEKEYRLLFDQKKCKTSHTETGKFYYVDIKPEALREIIIGCNVDPAIENNVLELLKDDKFKHIQIKKAVIDHNHYKLIYMDY